MKKFIISTLTCLLISCIGTPNVMFGQQSLKDSTTSVYEGDTILVWTKKSPWSVEKHYVIDGKQSMTVFKDTRVLVADSVAMAVSILDGEKPVTDTVYNNGTKEVPTKQTDIVVVTRDNVKKALIDSGYYKLSDFEGIE